VTKFCTQLGYINYQVPVYEGQITLKSGVVRVIWPVIHFEARNYTFGTAEAKVAKIWMQVNILSASFGTTDCP